MSTVSKLREMLYKAKEYKEALDGFRNGNNSKPNFDMKLNALVPVIERRMPLKAHTHRADDICTVIRIAKEFDVLLTIEHCTEGHLIVDVISECGCPVAVGPTLTHAIKFELKNKIDKKIEYEVLLIDVEQYIKTKLELMDSNVKKVFGERLTFKLVEPNIKEGSFDEVCKPTVLDKQTLLIDGSGAEKIQSGIYIIECIKEKMGIFDAPIIFDECDKLDSVSLTKLYTNSQIISTKVDDVNYDKVTLVTSK